MSIWTVDWVTLDDDETLSTGNNSVVATAHAVKSYVDNIPANPGVYNILHEYIGSPSTGDKKILLFTSDEMNLSKISAVVSGVSPSIEYNIHYGPDVTSEGTAVLSSNAQVTSETTGQFVTEFSIGTIPSDNWVWIKFGTVGLLTDDLNIVMKWTS